MFFKIVLLCCVSFGFAAPPAPPPTNVAPLEKQQPTVIPIISQSEELEPNGTYKFSYETGNGIKREETSYDKVLPKAQGRSASSSEGGKSNESDESDEIHVQEGSYSYTAPDGTVISVKYIADENGFRPVGDHIPKAPSSVFSVSSGEKSDSSKIPDNAEAGSAPAVLTRSGLKSEPTEPKSEQIKSTESAIEASSAPSAADSEATTKLSATTEAPALSEAPVSSEASSAPEAPAVVEATASSEASAVTKESPAPEVSTSLAPKEAVPSSSETSPTEAAATTATA